MSGFIHNPHADPRQYVQETPEGLTLGVVSPIKKPVIQPDRDWRPWRPAPEIQTKNGFDPLSCSSYGTLNAIEMYLHRVYGVKKNYSDRWLATKTGTKEKGGNDPHYVFEYIRKSGVVEEEKWPFTTQRTYDEYYSGNPALDAIAEDFNKEFKLEHDSIYGGAAEIWDALQYCPVPLSVKWERTDNGYWWKESAGPDNHWLVADHGKEQDYIGTFDSGEPSEKKATWNKLRPQLAKTFVITKRDSETQISLMQRVIVLLRQLLASLKPSAAVDTSDIGPNSPATRFNEPTPSPTPTPTQNRKEDVFNAAIKCLGKDLSQKAPDERGCAEAVSRVLRFVYPNFPIITSTIELDKHLKASKSFKQVATPTRGCVTMFKTHGPNIGHVGIWGNTRVLSNDSRTGEFQANYDFTSWYAAAKKRGLPLTHFQPL